MLFGRSHFKPQKKSTKKNPKRGPKAIKPDLARKRKAHVESDVTVLLSAYLWNLVLQCGYPMLFAAISYYLSRATVFSYMLLFAMLGCCNMLLFAATCCCLLVFAAVCSCLLMVVAIYCCLLLVAAVCCFLTVVCFFWLRIAADRHFMFFALSFQAKNGQFLVNS